MKIAFTIPQLPPFNMIDEVKYHDQQQIRCLYKIANSNPLIENGVFTPEGMIECMAQAAAAKASIEADKSAVDGRKSTIGYLVLIRSFECYATAAKGETIEPVLKLKHNIHPFKIFDAAIWMGNYKIASGEIRTFETS